MHSSSRILNPILTVLMVVGLVGGMFAPQAAQAASTGLVISQVYGGGGNSGATFTHDFIEIFNLGSSPVSLGGLSLQYTSATGTGSFGASSTQLTELPNTDLQPGQYFLVQQAQGSGGTTALPTPDLIDPTPIAMSGTAGKVALVTGATGLGCNGSSTPCSAEQLARIVDLIGYGSANFFEGSGAAPTLTNSTAALRAGDGCTDSDNNSTDFSADSPNPRNSLSPLNICSGGTVEPVINEFVVNHISTDTNEYVEVFGMPNTDYANLSLIQIEGDSPNAGTIKSVTPVGSTDANGFWTTGFLNNAFENGTITLLLVDGFTGALGTDLDTNDDGTPDSAPWTAIVDSVAVSDGGSSDLTYATPVLSGGFDGVSFVPGGASRIPNGVDTDSVSDWLRNDFDLAGISGFPGTPVAGEALNTPGVTNVAVTPASAPLVGIVASDDAAAESGSDAGTFTVSRTGDTAAALSVSYTVGGTATNGSDYTPNLSGSVEIPAGAASADITIIPVDDADIEGNETVMLTLVDGSDYDLGTPSSATVTIADNDVVPPVACSAGDTPIGEVQGSGSASPLQGQTVTVQGVIVGDFEGATPGFRGFFLQNTPDNDDDDPLTSDGIFVFVSNNSTDRMVGQVVQVTGTAGEFSGQTQISVSNPAVQIEDCGDTGSITPTDITLPLSEAERERYEGMLINLPQALVISEYFNYDRFGEIVISLPLDNLDRPFTPTSYVEPGAAAQALAEQIALRRITLDDGLGNQNPDVLRHPNGQPFSQSNFFRGGDTVQNTVGVLDYRFGLFRIQPTAPAEYTAVNLRPAAPEPVGGSLKVASFNVLNYFLTLDDGTNDICGPLQNQECRGADDATEFERQEAKIVAAILGIDADIIGLIEMENTPGVEPAERLAEQLNAAQLTDTYAFIDTGTIGGDAIRVGFIYKSNTVTPVGDFAVLDSNVDPRFIDTKNRPALAQTFRENATGGVFTASINHFKSKGSACNDVGDPDLGDGAGNCNITRTQAALALADWLATDPTNSGDPDVMILGDLNSYDEEDPIDALKLAGYTDLNEFFGGEFAYSYVFDGQFGYLDYALANPSLTAQVTGATEWHINADESDAFDYDTSFKPDPIDALYEPNPFRSSDHDPVLVGLNLDAPLACTVIDDFNRNDGPLGNRWAGEDGLGGYAIRNSMVEVFGGGPIFWKGANQNLGVDQYACVTLNDLDEDGLHQSLLLKVQGGNGLDIARRSMIAVGYDAANSRIVVETYRHNTQTWTTIADFAYGLSDGDVFGAAARSDGSVTVYVNGNKIGVVAPSDPGAASLSFFQNRRGRVGLWFIDAAGARFDDFAAGNLE
ncbi:MAG: ExeM/NucH family extracellular endonuclease [Oscillochloris sp.]|nr:ExeM/NucH family extracellular endonuclease [Oscillochloris sp.]